jgi:hypothetical protein
VRTDPIHDERAKQEKQAALEIAVAGSACAGESGGFGAGSATLPPAASIAARAPFDACTPFRASLRVSLPERITFALCVRCGTTRSAFSVDRSISLAFMRSSSLVRTSTVRPRVGEVKPRFGSRRCKGI